MLHFEFSNIHISVISDPSRISVEGFAHDILSPFHPKEPQNKEHYTLPLLEGGMKLHIILFDPESLGV